SQSSRGDAACQQLSQLVLVEPALAAFQFRGQPRIDVDAHDVQAAVGEGRGHARTDKAQSDDGDPPVLVLGQETHGCSNPSASQGDAAAVADHQALAECAGIGGGNRRVAADHGPSDVPDVRYRGALQHDGIVDA